MTIMNTKQHLQKACPRLEEVLIITSATKREKRKTRQWFWGLAKEERDKITDFCPIKDIDRGQDITTYTFVDGNSVVVEYHRDLYAARVDKSNIVLYVAAVHYFIPNAKTFNGSNIAALAHYFDKIIKDLSQNQESQKRDGAYVVVGRDGKIVFVSIGDVIEKHDLVDKSLTQSGRYTEVARLEDTLPLLKDNFEFTKPSNSPGGYQSLFALMKKYFPTSTP